MKRGLGIAVTFCIRIVAICLFTAGIVYPTVRAESPGPPQIASRAPGLGQTGGAPSHSPAFSGNGRFVVFVSQANNLVPNDRNGDRMDVFARDLAAGTTELISVNLSGSGGGNGNSYNPIISSNGQFVVFQGTASDLVTNTTSGVTDLYLRDRVGGTTELISISVSGASGGNGHSRHALMTPDGRFVAFESLARNLAASDSSSEDIFVRDRQEHTTICLTPEAIAAFRQSQQPGSISAGGERVAFFSDCLRDIPGSQGEVYVHDLSSHTTTWASTNTLAGDPDNPHHRSFDPSLSADGRHVAFKTATALGTNLYTHDLTTSETTLIWSNVLEEGFPQMTANGRYIGFAASTGVYLWDRNSGQTTLVSENTRHNGPALGTSLRPAVSAFATRVAFLSDAGDVTANSTAGRFQIYARDMPVGRTLLVSTNGAGQPGPDLAGDDVALSPDGTLLAFASTDNTIVPEDFNQASDVFLRELDTGITRAISACAPSLASGSAAGRLAIEHPQVSRDGRWISYVAGESPHENSDGQPGPHGYVQDFATGQSRSVPRPNESNPPLGAIQFSGDGHLAVFSRVENSNSQVYLRDVWRGTDLLVSQSLTGGPANGWSDRPVISLDGSRVAFQSTATDLHPLDRTGQTDIFFHDTGWSSNRLVSIATNGLSAGDSWSTNATISPDGRWIIFYSYATDIAPGSSGFHCDIREVSSDIIYDAFSGLDPNDPPLTKVSSSSRFFLLDGLHTSNLGQRKTYLIDLFTRTNTLVCSDCIRTECSADGRIVVYESPGNSTAPNIVAKDLRTGLAELISVNAAGAGGGNGPSHWPVVSADGRYVAFVSRASDLVPDDTNGRTDLFVRDRILHTTLRIGTRQTDANSGVENAIHPVMGLDGRTVLFQSSATAPNDFNNQPDLFLLRLEAGDRDGDNLEDDWELAYFGTLARDGSADFDSDGQSDAAEFRAGTDPSNSGSILRVLTLLASGGRAMVFWSAQPGKVYRLQFKDDLTDAPWAELGTTVTATGSTAWVEDSSTPPAGGRYYRVMLQE